MILYVYIMNIIICFKEYFLFSQMTFLFMFIYVYIFLNFVISFR